MGGRMMNKKLISFASFLLVALGAVFGQPPKIPFSPWGSVTINGQPAADGLSVKAYINDVLVAEMPGGTVGGYYALVVPADNPDTPAKDGGAAGDSIVVRVDGKVVSQTLIWQSADTQRYDLSIVQRTIVVSASQPGCAVGDAYYTTVSEAVNNANDGDSIIICPGSYQDNVVVNVSVSLDGSDPNTTTITSADGGHIFYVLADDVTIRGLKLTGASGQPNSSAILVEGKRTNITGNIITANSYGIETNPLGPDTEVVENIITFNGEGIILGSNNNTAVDNVIESNTKYGIRVANGDNNIIRDNTIKGGQDGIWLHDTADNNLIRNNDISGNSDAGIELRGSNGNTITYNNVRTNGKGVMLEQASTTNIVEFNNITSNTFNIYNNQADAIAAENNWWGSTVCTIIDNGIFDDEEGKGTVDFDPVLDAEFASGSSVPCGSSLPIVVHQSSPACVTGISYYSTISSAVAAANNGDRIVVCPGLYEENISITKSLTIESHGGPSVTTVRSCNYRDGGGNCRGFGHVFQVTGVSNVVISGFTLTGTEPNPFAAVYLVSTSDSTIKDNIITGNDIGVMIDFQSFNNLIYNNSFSSNNTNAQDASGANLWNVPVRPGTNIIGGGFVGGNYWDDYLGADLNADGIGDTLLPYNANGNIIGGGGDFYPLVP